MLFERLSWEENLALGGASPGSIGLDLSDVTAQACARASELDFTLPPPGVRVADCAIATPPAVARPRGQGAHGPNVYDPYRPLSLILLHLK
jgi:hypothetical protein